MGLKASRNRELFEDDSPHSGNMVLPSKPYCFLSGGEIKSFSVPTMVKYLRNANRNGHPGFQREPDLTSVAFLRDERYLVFGSVCADLDTYSIQRRLFDESLSQHGNLSLVDLQLSQIQVLENLPVRDICLASCCEHLGFITYSGYSRLHVCPCNPLPQLDNSQIFKEKDEDLLSHSTCCGFSPDGKWFVMGICSDYFMNRSKSHLVIRQASLHDGKYSKSKVIKLVGKQVPEYFSHGVLISLEFSPDSTLLAVGCTQNIIYILNTGTWELVSIIGELYNGSSYAWGVFHPSCTQKQFISCTYHGQLEQFEVQQQERDMISLRLQNKMNLCDGSHTRAACCPTFAPNGRLLAVGFLNGRVVIVEPNSFSACWTISPEFVLDDLNTPRLSASSLCFSKSCQYLAIGYSGDIVTVWSLPYSSFTLKHFCRSVVISLYPANMIAKLHIPSSLKQYLLYQSQRMDSTK